MLPTPTNPLIIVNTQETIAMKNSVKILMSPKGKIHGVGRSKKVRIILSKGHELALIHRDAQGFDNISIPNLVGVYVRIGFFGKQLLTNDDLDNAFTSIQETWAGSVIDNDRQVIDSHQSKFVVPDKSLEHSVTFMWVVPEEHYQRPTDCFLEFCNSVWYTLRTTEIIKELEKK